MFQVFRLKPFVKANLMSLFYQPETERNILDRRRCVGHLIKSAQIKKCAFPDRATAGPEGRRHFAGGLMNVVMHQVLELRNKGLRGRLVIIQTKHGAHVGMTRKMFRDEEESLLR
jgi:hypothetical protein